MTRNPDNPGYDAREGMKPIQHPEMFEQWRICGRSMSELAKQYDRSRPYFYRMAETEDWAAHADALDKELAESLRLAQEQSKHRFINEVTALMDGARALVASSYRKLADRDAAGGDIDFQEISAFVNQVGGLRDQGAKHFGLDKLTLELNKSTSFADEVAAAMAATQNKQEE